LELSSRWGKKKSNPPQAKKGAACKVEKKRVRIEIRPPPLSFDRPRHCKIWKVLLIGQWGQERFRKGS
jgi:hypothetical protein